MSSPEKIKIEKEPEIEEREKLKNFMELISSQLRKEGVPVDNRARIDMDAFKERYSEEVVSKNKRQIARFEREWYRNLTEEEIEEKRMKTPGEKMEMLKTAIFYKNLSSDFIVARTSSFDDALHGVDNIILERETGNLVCAFDEVATVSEDTYKKKRKKVLERNMEGPPGLRYGLRMEGKKNKKELKLDRVRGVPIFYLALSPRHIEKAIRGFEPDLEKQSDYEKELFNLFIDSLNSQLEYLGKRFNDLPPKVRKRISVFGQSLKKFKTKT